MPWREIFWLFLERSVQNSDGDSDGLARHRPHAEEEMNISDVMIHIAERLSPAARNGLENALRSVDGVIAPRFNPGREHLLLVAFNGDRVRPGALLGRVREAGYSARLVAI
jgi:hypothetical protein